MIQWALIPQKCSCCGEEYYTFGYWGDNRYCLSCSIHMRREEEEEKKRLAKQAAGIAEEYGLDLDQYANELPEDVRRYLNPKNAGRKAVKYRPEFCELLVASAAEGKTEVEFAVQIGISQSLITYWTEKHPRFKQAREIANDHRQARFEKEYRDAMLCKIACVPSLLGRLAAAKWGWGEKGETAINTGEIPVVKIVERDAGFPSEKVEPTAEQLAEAGLDKETEAI